MFFSKEAKMFDTSGTCCFLADRSVIDSLSKTTLHLIFTYSDQYLGFHLEPFAFQAVGRVSTAFLRQPSYNYHVHNRRCIIQSTSDSQLNWPKPYEHPKTRQRMTRWRKRCFTPKANESVNQTFNYSCHLHSESLHGITNNHPHLQ